MIRRLESHPRHHQHHTLVDTFSTPTLLGAVAAGQLDPTRFTTYRFPLEAAMGVDDAFAQAGEANALKVLMAAPG